MQDFEPDPLLQKEFGVYSSYIRLNFENQVLVADREVVQYYKEVAQLLREEVKRLKSQVNQYEETNNEYCNELANYK